MRVLLKNNWKLLLIVVVVAVVIFFAWDQINIERQKVYRLRQE